MQKQYQNHSCKICLSSRTSKYNKRNFKNKNKKGQNQTLARYYYSKIKTYNREDRIRTCDTLVPNQVLYQAELLPVVIEYILSLYAPQRSRTSNRLIRSQVLYPVELRVLYLFYYAEDRNRTGTIVTNRRILSPVRLPVPPPRPLSERRDSNPRPPPWQGGVLPLNYVRIYSLLYSNAGYMT